MPTKQTDEFLAGLKFDWRPTVEKAIEEIRQNRAAMQQQMELMTKLRQWPRLDPRTTRRDDRLVDQRDQVGAAPPASHAEHAHDVLSTRSPIRPIAGWRKRRSANCCRCSAGQRQPGRRAASADARRHQPPAQSARQQAGTRRHVPRRQEARLGRRTAAKSCSSTSGPRGAGHAAPRCPTCSKTI